MAENNTRQIYTVSLLTKEIKILLEESFPFVWVTGEISNYATPASGHSYFTLKDSGAIINAVMFKNQKRKLKFQPENGMNIFGLARISLYEPRGSYQLIFEHLEPEGTGSLQIAFEQLKNKLSEQGYFDQKHKKSIPYLPAKVCVITSRTGAAVRDIINIASRRFPNCCINILPVKVQGEGADTEICRALETSNCQMNPDLIILARGGGSLEDLAAFNSENVAMSIFHSEIPVITGVGHETDYTIADFVSDLRAPTPSAAAELAFPDKAALEYTVFKHRSLLYTLVSHELNSCRKRILQASARLKTPMRMVYDAQMKLEDLQERMLNSKQVILKMKKANLFHLLAMMQAVHPGKKTGHLRSGLNNLRARLETLNPENVLKRGYSISRLLPSKEIIKDADAVSKGDTVQVIVAKGELITKVEKKYGEKKNI